MTTYEVLAGHFIEHRPLILEEWGFFVIKKSNTLSHNMVDIYTLTCT